VVKHGDSRAFLFAGEGLGSWVGVGGPFLKLGFAPEIRLVLRFAQEPRLRTLGVRLDSRGKN
jgi:hypothetical protein